MSAISQLLLNRFWPNFKTRFLGPSWTDSSCHGDICPANNCPGNICPYQSYLSCYWANFDQTLKIDSWENLEVIPTLMATFVQETFVHFRNISAVTDPILTELFLPNFLRALIFWPKILFHPIHNNFLDQNFFGDICPYQE